MPRGGDRRRLAAPPALHRYVAAGVGRPAGSSSARRTCYDVFDGRGLRWPATALNAEKTASTEGTRKGPRYETLHTTRLAGHSRTPYT
jgi:hypothetical protein